MTKIFKYTHPVSDTVMMSVPQGAVLRSVGMDTRSNDIAFWYEINPDEDKKQTVFFYIFGTGHNIPIGLIYVDSVIQGTYVWHIYRGA